VKTGRPCTETVSFDLDSLIGKVVRGIEIISKPQWVDGEWRALANVHGMLGVVALSIKIVGE